MMKVKFDIECTPQEDRAWMGRQDVAPMQEDLMKELESQLAETSRSLEPETTLNTWLPATTEGWGQVQKRFGPQMGLNPSGRPDEARPAQAKKYASCRL